MKIEKNESNLHERNDSDDFLLKHRKKGRFTKFHFFIQLQILPYKPRLYNNKIVKCQADSTGVLKKIDFSSILETKRIFTVGTKLLKDLPLNFHLAKEVLNNVERDTPTQLSSATRSARTRAGSKIRTIFFTNFIYSMDPNGQCS